MTPSPYQDSIVSCICACSLARVYDSEWHLAGVPFTTPLRTLIVPTPASAGGARYLGCEQAPPVSRSCRPNNIGIRGNPRERQLEKVPPKAPRIWAYNVIVGKSQSCGSSEYWNTALRNRRSKHTQLLDHPLNCGPCLIPELFLEICGFYDAETLHRLLPQFDVLLVIPL